MRYSLLVAAVYRCPNCGAWWAGQSGNAPEAHLILHMVERRTTLFPWEKYRGWKRDLFDEELCPDCGQEISHPHFSLSQQAPHS